MQSKKIVSIIGMAGIFPQGKNIQEYWQNILEGIDCSPELLRKLN